jgi:predicted DsbA family dithiol-disulfide isomerase
MSDLETNGTPAELVVWIDPGCPWAWQTSLWVRELRDAGLVTIEWRLFSLEVNTAGVDVPFEEAADRYGPSLRALALAKRDRGDRGLEDYYVALGTLLHERGDRIAPEIAAAAAAAAGDADLVDRACADPSLAHEVVQAYRDARELDVFGVPTLQLAGAAPIYGPIMPDAPTGDDALEWWHHVSWLIGHDDLYEFKRWPRARRPAVPIVP